ncbi:hypothetical protein [Acetobacter thailandicus]|uniref:hypothetical protein n=1 Tax=Acetobacter thailandicus TaxID=1502842 RepID=UPI001BA84889|nr:hypothetical protein [Acetobacter thailandicus]MBS0961138.1 hypothetical protein [Acetobacter thailandicus]MBS0986871.1 hypothetical protein [Acetobacter thailandicus]MBS1003867.1 hypothetical protein [Acetobacter thailandicus]
MKSLDDRALFSELIAAGAQDGNVADIPASQAVAGDGTASVALGFPPETFVARSAGGVPPRGQDMNGFLKYISQAIQFLQATSVSAFDSGFAAKIGGYPMGAVVAGITPGGVWRSVADNNVSIPGTMGAAWVNFFGDYVQKAGDTISGALAVTGTLRSDSNVIVANSQNKSVVNIRVTNEGYLSFDLNSADQTNLASLRVYPSGEITSRKGILALTSQLPDEGSTGSGRWYQIGNTLVQNFRVPAVYRATGGTYVAFPKAFSDTDDITIQLTTAADNNMDVWAFNPTTAGFYINIPSNSASSGLPVSVTATGAAR